MKTLTIAAIALMALAGCSTDESRGYPPCLTEEAGPEFTACYWDGDTRGNKTGLSYINVGDGTVIYLP